MMLFPPGVLWRFSDKCIPIFGLKDRCTSFQEVTRQQVGNALCLRSRYGWSLLVLVSTILR